GRAANRLAVGGAAVRRANTAAVGSRLPAGDGLAPADSGAVNGCGRLTKKSAEGAEGAEGARRRATYDDTGGAGTDTCSGAEADRGAFPSGDGGSDRGWADRAGLPSKRVGHAAAGRALSAAAARARDGQRPQPLLPVHAAWHRRRLRLLHLAR